MFQCFLDYMAEVTTFGAIAVPVRSFVMMALYGAVKPVLGFFDLVPDAGQVGYLKRSAILLNEIGQGYAVKCQFSVMKVETFLWEIICLLDKVKITVLHSSG